MKKWVIPDLHGCVKSLRALVEDHIQPTREDVIFFLGDYIDRGPDSKGVLDYIMNLQQEGYKVKALRGNHEEYLLKARDEEKQGKRKLLFWKGKRKLFAEWYRHGGSNTLESFGVKKVKDIPEKYVQWMRELPYYFIEDNYVVVHAGLNLDRLDPFEDKYAMLWTKSFNSQPEKIQGKVVIHGHVPVSLQFIRTNLQNTSSKYFAIDNGCFMTGQLGMGNLTAIELTSKKLVVQKGLD